MHGRVLVVAGSDSGGGAGIQADIKAILAMRAHASTAVTALTAQDTQGVHGVWAVPPDFVVQQMRVVLRDIGADAIKTGMLGDAALIQAVIETLATEAPATPLVVDPVMVAKGGAVLLPDSALAALRGLVARATMVTPNAPEAAALTGEAVTDESGLRRAAASLLRMGAASVLAKGGHVAGEQVVDVLATVREEWVFRAPRQRSRHTHGTGCTLASAAAAGLAQGMSLHDAVERAHLYVQAAIAAAPGLGAGHGPLGHDAWFSPSSR